MPPYCYPGATQKATEVGYLVWTAAVYTTSVINIRTLQARNTWGIYEY